MNKPPLQKRLQIRTKPILFHQPIQSDRNNKIKEPPYSRTFCSSSCHCDDCGKRSKFMRKIFQLYKFPQTNQWKKQKNFRKFRKLIHCIIYIIRYRIVKRIKTKKKFTIKKALNKTPVIEPVKLPSTIQNAISELKLIVDSETPKTQSRFRAKKQDKSTFATLLNSKGRRNLRQLFFIPQNQSPIKQFIIRNSKPNTAHNSPMQSLYDFKMTSSFRGL